MLVSLVALLLAVNTHAHSGHCVGRDAQELRHNADAVYVNTNNGQVWVRADSRTYGPYVFCYVGKKGE